MDELLAEVKTGKIKGICRDGARVGYTNDGGKSWMKEEPTTRQTQR